MTAQTGSKIENLSQVIDATCFNSENASHVYVEFSDGREFRAPRGGVAALSRHARHRQSVNRSWSPVRTVASSFTSSHQQHDPPHENSAPHC